MLSLSQGAGYCYENERSDYVEASKAPDVLFVGLMRPSHACARAQAFDELAHFSTKHSQGVGAEIAINPIQAHHILAVGGADESLGCVQITNLQPCDDQPYGAGNRPTSTMSSRRATQATAPAILCARAGVEHFLIVCGEAFAKHTRCAVLIVRGALRCVFAVM